MIKECIFSLILFVLSNCIYSQIDYVKSQSINNEDLKSTIIANGRKLLLNKFIEGDLKSVAEIKNYLIEIEDNDNTALCSAEYSFLLYWTKDYTELVKKFQLIEFDKTVSDDKRTKPLNTLLYNTLKDKSFKSETLLKKQIEDSEIDPEIKQVVSMNLDRLLLEERETIYAQDSLNIRADNFLETYSKSKYEHFIRQHIRYKLIPRDWKYSIELFSGFGVFTGNLSEYYSNNLPLGLALDINYKNFELYLRHYVGFNKLKKDFDYSLGIGQKDSRAGSYLQEVSLGYVVYNDNKFKLSPFAGIAKMGINSSNNGEPYEDDTTTFDLEPNRSYVLGINFDIQNKGTGYVRIRYGYAMPKFEKQYDEMTGNMHYITIGVGGRSKRYKREF